MVPLGSLMQTAITTQIQKVQQSVDSLSDRVDHLEDDFSDTVEQVRACQTSLSSFSPSSIDSEGPTKQRKHHTSPDISVSQYHHVLVLIF